MAKDNAKAELIASLFYEINNPLQILLALAERDPNPEYMKQLVRIVEVVSHLHDDNITGSASGDTDASDSAAATALTPCDPTRILVVDDEEMVRQVFVHAIEDSLSDLTVESAANGAEGIELFQKSRPGIIIMDVFMPVMNGEKAFRELERICERDGYQMPRVIFCTGYMVSSVLEDLIGDQSYHAGLRKPFKTQALIDLVTQAISSYADA